MSSNSFQGKAIIFSAPSGAGKTTIVRYLLEKELPLLFSISACSRNRRPNEIDGKDYNFVSKDSFKEKIDSNTSLAKDISLGAFDGENFKKFADDNGLLVKDYKISNIKQNDVFDEGLVKRIFLTKDGDINLITNSTLTKSFLISTKNTEYKELDKKGNEFEQYEAKARLNLINKIYQSYDENANQKYKVEVNQRTIDRVKNSFQ